MSNPQPLTIDRALAARLEHTGHGLDRAARACLELLKRQPGEAVLKLVLADAVNDACRADELLSDIIADTRRALDDPHGLLISNAGRTQLVLDPRFLEFAPDERWDITDRVQIAPATGELLLDDRIVEPASPAARKLAVVLGAQPGLPMKITDAMAAVWCGRHERDHRRGRLVLRARELEVALGKAVTVTFIGDKVVLGANPLQS